MRYKVQIEERVIKTVSVEANSIDDIRGKVASGEYDLICEEEAELINCHDEEAKVID